MLTAGVYTLVWFPETLITWIVRCRGEQERDRPTIGDGSLRADSQVSLKLASDSRGVETRAEGAPTGTIATREHWLPPAPPGRSKLSRIARTQ